MFSVKTVLAAFGISMFLFMVVIGEAAAHDPLSDWDDCPASATSTASQFAPLPEFALTTVGSPVTAWPSVGSYDFCAYMDTLYCQWKPMGAVEPEIEDIATLTRCIDGDINGPLDLMGDPPHTPNGILDGQYELGILAAVLNDPTHPLHGDAHTAIQNNFIYFKNLIQTSLSTEGWLAMMPLMTPYLIGSLSMTLAGYATLGDPTTYEAIDALLPFYEFLGTTPDPDGSASDASPVPETGPDEDIDGDNLTNREEHDIVVVQFGYTGPEYVIAALDPEQPGLNVIPAAGLDALGYEGGPFTPVSETYTVSNYFTSSTDWTASVTEPWLTVSPESGTLAPSGSTSVAVSLNINTTSLPPGDYTATLSIVPDSYATTTRNIYLTVLPIPGEIAVTDTIVPDNDYDMPFGDTVITLSYAEQVTVTNVDATYDLVIDGVELESVLFSLGDNGFTLDNLPLFPITLTPGNAFTFDVLFEPLGEGLHEDSIVIESNDVFTPEVTVALSAVAAWDPMAVAPETGFLAQGHEGGPFVPAAKTYTVTNDGATPLNWSATAPAWLTVAPDNGFLGAGLSEDVIISVNTTADALPLGHHAGTLVFTNGDTAITVNREVALLVASATGTSSVTDSIAPADDRFLPFGDVYVGASRTEVVAIHNTSMVDDLVVEDVSLDSMYYTEDFEDGLAQNWTPTSPSQWTVDFGRYRAADSSFTGYMQSTLLDGNWSDAIFEVAVQQSTDDSRTVLSMRASDDFLFDTSGSGICLIIYGFGYYEFYEQYDGYVVPGNSNLCEDLLADGTPKQVCILMEDNLFTFYVNGNRIASIRVYEAPETGRIGLGGYTETVDPLIYYFDDIKIFHESQFRLESIPTLPHILGPGEFLAVNALFEPIRRGFHQDSMHITTNSVYESEIEVMLTGSGIGHRRYVKMDGDDADDGLSWATAKATLQAALELADVGDDIWVAAGTYYPTSTDDLEGAFNNDRTKHFRLKEGVYIYGGFNGTEVSPDQRNWETNLTQLSGDINEPGNIDDNCYRIICNINNDTRIQDTILDGFTISDANADGWYEGSLWVNLMRGGGLLGYYDNLIIVNCTFKNNTSEQNASGAYIEGNNIQFINCLFESNRSTEGDGGGLYINAYNVSLIDCEFRDNVVGPEEFVAADAGFGGAFFSYGKNILLENCSFENNSVSTTDMGCGGALMLFLGDYKIENCLFEANSLDLVFPSGVPVGGGAIAAFDCNLSVTNSIFNGNYSNSAYGGSAIMAQEQMSSDYNGGTSIVNSVFVDNHSSTLINTLSFEEIRETNLTNCIIFNNSSNSIGDYNSITTVTYSNVQGGFTGTGNIDADPMFVNAAAGDFRLLAGSPSINTGDPAGVPPAPETDIIGTLRPQDGAVDMGAYEYDTTPPDVTLTLQSPLQTGADEILFAATFSEPVLTPDAADFAVTGSLAGAVSVAGSGADYVVTVSLSAPDTDGTVGIELLPGATTDPSGNPCAGGVSPLCQVLNWRGFLVEPANARLYHGDSHTLSVVSDCGASNISYQWKWDDGAKAIADGPTTQDWVINEVTLSMAGTYWCEAAYDGVIYATSHATIEVEPPLEIVIMPEGAEKAIGESHEFTIDVVGGYMPLAYEWMKDGIPIPSAPDAPVYALTNLTEADDGLYSVTVHDDNAASIQTPNVRLLVGASMSLAGLVGLAAAATSLLFVGAYAVRKRRDP